MVLRCEVEVARFPACPAIGHVVVVVFGATVGAVPCNGLFFVAFAFALATAFFATFGAACALVMTAFVVQKWVLNKWYKVCYMVCEYLHLFGEGSGRF